MNAYHLGNVVDLTVSFRDERTLQPAAPTTATLHLQLNGGAIEDIVLTPASTIVYAYTPTAVGRYKVWVTGAGAVVAVSRPHTFEVLAV